MINTLSTFPSLSFPFSGAQPSDSCGNERLSAAIKKSFDRLMWDSSVLTIDSCSQPISGEFLSQPLKGNRQEDTGMSSADLLETEIQSSADVVVSRSVSCW